MATSTLGFLSPFVAGQTTLSSLPPYSIRFFHLPQTPANLRTVRAVTVSQPSTGKPLRGIMRPRRVSPEMQELVGVPEISRTQVLKQIWAYIKDNNLQDPENKKIIICDEKLKKIFGGKNQVGFLEIAGLISPHFL